MFHGGVFHGEPHDAEGTGDTGTDTQVAAASASPVAAANVAAAQLRFAPIRDNPLARAEALGAAVDGRLYVMGGLRTVDGRVVAIRRCDVYEPASNTWRRLGDMPFTPITHAGTAVDGRHIWFVGSYVGDHPGPGNRGVYRYDTATDTWQREPDLPVDRGAGAAAVVGRTLYFFGGLGADRGPDHADHLALNLDNPAAGWQRRASLPDARNHVSGAALGGKVYVIGGQRDEEEAQVALSSVHRYDPATDAWTQVASLPGVRSHATQATFAYGGRIYVVGGETGFMQTRREVFAYDPAADQWTQVGRLPAGRSTMVAGAIDGKIYAATGNSPNASSKGWVATIAAANEPGNPPPAPNPDPTPDPTPPGGGGEPELTVLLDAAPLAANAAVAFGTGTRGFSAGPARTFTVRNDGSGDLFLGAVSVPEGFLLVEGPSAIALAPGESDTVRVALATGLTGTFAGTVVLSSNDADEAAFAVNVAGTVEAPPPMIAIAGVSGGLPAVVPSAGGKPARGAMAVAVSNDSGGAFRGPVAVQVSAAPAGDSDPAHVMVLGAATRTLKLDAAAQAALKVKLTLPQAATAGEMALTVTLTANGATATAPGGTVRVEPRSVRLVGATGVTNVGALAFGRRAAVPVVLQNLGSVPTTRRPVTYHLTVATDPAGAAPVYQTSAAGRVNLKPGASKAQKLRVSLPPQFPPGSYFLLVRLDAELNETNGEVAAVLAFAIA